MGGKDVKTFSESWEAQEMNQTGIICVLKDSGWKHSKKGRPNGIVGGVWRERTALYPDWVVVTSLPVLKCLELYAQKSVFRCIHLRTKMDKKKVDC